jgi:hypothetical protein
LSLKALTEDLQLSESLLERLSSGEISTAGATAWLRERLTNLIASFLGLNVIV